MKLFFKDRRNSPSEVASTIQKENAQRWVGDNQDAGIYIGEGKIIICHPDYSINGISLTAEDLSALLREVVIRSKGISR